MSRIIQLATAMAAVAAGAGTTHMAIAQPTAAVYEVHPEDYCNAACPSPGGDWSPVFDAMLEDCTPEPSNANEAYKARQGCRIDLGCKVYNLSRPIVAERAHLISGCGRGMGDWGNTTLRFYNPTDGIIADAINAQVTLRDLALMGSNTSTTTHGVLAGARINLQSVGITRFGRGVRIDASFAQNHNANGWFMQDVGINGVRGWGVYIRGADANAGVAVRLDVSNACGAMRPDDPPTDGHVCWAIRDNSFLGNTYVGPHTAYAWGPAGPTTNGFPQYIVEGANAPSVLVGPYQEGQAAGSLLSGQGVAIGGNVQNLGEASFPVFKRNGAGARFYSDNAGGRVLLGDGAAAWRLLATSGEDLRFTWDPVTRTYGWKPGGAGAGEGGVTGPTSRTAHGLPLRSGWTWTSRNLGAYEGPPTSVVARVLAGAGPVEADCGGHPVGSTRELTRPVLGQPATWRCYCLDGTPTPQGGCASGERAWVAN